LCHVHVVTRIMLQVYVEHESVAVTRQQQSEPINLDYCLEAFTKEEHLGEDEKYYCSKCREHQLASKKLQIWRLPPILVSIGYAKCLFKTRLQETVTPAEVQTYRYTVDSYWCTPPILLNCWKHSRSASSTTQHT
jgi:ubiquitin C-terminal hydrolase